MRSCLMLPRPDAVEQPALSYRAARHDGAGSLGKVGWQGASMVKGGQRQVWPVLLMSTMIPKQDRQQRRSASPLEVLRGSAPPPERRQGQPCRQTRTGSGRE